MTDNEIRKRALSLALKDCEKEGYLEEYIGDNLFKVIVEKEFTTKDYMALKDEEAEEARAEAEEARAEAEEVKKEANERVEKAKEAEMEANERAEKAERGEKAAKERVVMSTIEMCKEFGVSFNDSIRRLQNKHGLSKADAEDKVNKYWNQ